MIRILTEEDYDELELRYSKNQLLKGSIQVKTTDLNDYLSKSFLEGEPLVLRVYGYLLLTVRLTDYHSAHYRGFSVIDKVAVASFVVQKVEPCSQTWQAI